MVFSQIFIFLRQSLRGPDQPQTHYVNTCGLEILILLRQPLESWDHRCTPAHLLYTVIEIQSWALSSFHKHCTNRAIAPCFVVIDPFPALFYHSPFPLLLLPFLPTIDPILCSCHIHSWPFLTPIPLSTILFALQFRGLYPQTCTHTLEYTDTHIKIQHLHMIGSMQCLCF